jgi:hypothetical protein
MIDSAEPSDDHPEENFPPVNARVSETPDLPATVTRRAARISTRT